MGMRTFLGFRASSTRDSSRRKGTKKKGALRQRRSFIEQCEPRLLLAGAPALQLVTVSPYETNSLGATVPSDLLIYSNPNITDTVLNTAPSELVLDFNQGQNIDPTTLGAIQVFRSGGDNQFQTVYNPATNTYAANPNNTIMDVPVPIGSATINKTYNTSTGQYSNNEVVLRFTQDLPADLYEIVIVGANVNAAPQFQSPLDGRVATPVVPATVPPTVTIPTPLEASPVGSSGAAATDALFNNGQDQAVFFTLQLGAQVTSVVPQPISRSGPIASQTLQAVAGSTITPGASFTLTNYSGANVTFVFDPAGTTLPAGEFLVPYTSGDKVAVVAQDIATAVSTSPSCATAAASGSTVVLSNLMGFAQGTSPITLTSIQPAAAAQIQNGDSFSLTGPSAPTPKTVQFVFGQTGATQTPGQVLIAYTTSDTAALLDKEIAAAVASAKLTGVTATAAATSVTLSGAAAFSEAGDEGLTQARNEVNIYFDQQLNQASAQDPSLYQLIATNNTANTTDDTIVQPSQYIVQYSWNAATQVSESRLIVIKDIHGNPLTDLTGLVNTNFAAGAGPMAFRLRVGTQYYPFSTDAANVTTPANYDETFANAKVVGVTRSTRWWRTPRTSPPIAAR